MKKAVIFLVCVLGIAGFTFMGMPHMQEVGASQDVTKVTSSDKMQEVAGYGESSDDDQDAGGYGSEDEDSGGYGSDDSGDSGSDSGGYGN